MVKSRDKIVFNISASSLNLYYTSQLQFYFSYLLGEKEDTFVTPVYGMSGNVVHETLEHYIKNIIPIRHEIDNAKLNDMLTRHFNLLWERKGIDKYRGAYNSNFSKNKPKYLKLQ